MMFIRKIGTVMYRIRVEPGVDDARGAACGDISRMGGKRHTELFSV